MFYRLSGERVENSQPESSAAPGAWRATLSLVEEVYQKRLMEANLNCPQTCRLAILFLQMQAFLRQKMSGLDQEATR